MSDNKEEKEVLVQEVAVGVILSSIAGIFFYGLGQSIGTDIDEAAPADATPRQGEELAVQQYKKLLTKIQQKKSYLEELKAKIPNAYVTNNSDVPEALIDSLQDKTDNNINYKKLELSIEARRYKDLMNDFFTASLVDRRLSEKTVEDLFTEVNENIADITEATGRELPDFSDIDYCRAKIDPANEDVWEASRINNCSRGRNLQENAKEISLTMGLSSALILGLGFVGGSYSEYRSKTKASRRRKLAKKLGHNN